MEISNKLVNWILAIGLLFPLFFQLSGGIYDGYSNDSGGNIATLPLPISILVCFGGLVLLIKRFRQADIALAFIGAMLLALLLSTAFYGLGSHIERRKLLLLAQFTLPIFALVLGKMVNDDEKVIPKAFLAVLLTIVPLQLIAGWMQGTLALTHSLYVFSIYQHFQFVPLVFMSAFAYATTVLWSTHQRTLLVFFPVMLIYVIASVSMLTIVAFIIFVVSFTTQQIKAHKKNSLSLILVSAFAFTTLTGIGIGSYLNLASSRSNDYGDHGAYIHKFQVLSEGKLPSNAIERWGDWKLFGNGIIESPQTVVFGHAEPLARDVRTSAHNWYLDIAYSFGLISLLPIFMLIGHTMRLFWRNRNRLALDTQWLAIVVFYLVVVDSNFKVTLRQPYPGIFAFFMWGLLLSRLSASRNFHSCIQACKE